MARRDIEAGRAFVRLQVQRSGFERAMISAQVKFAALAKVAQLAARAVTAAFRGIAGAIPSLVGGFAEAGDKLDKMSKRTRVSVEALSELKFAAEQSGTNIDSLSQGLFRMGRRIANSATQTGPAARAMKELGLSGKELSKLRMEDQFVAIVDALDGMDNQFRANQLGFELFGDNFRDLAPLLQEGAAGIEKLRQQARGLGLTVSGEQAAAAAAVADAQNEAVRAFEALKFQLGSEFAPAAVAVLKVTTHLVKGMQQLAEFAIRGFKIMIGGLTTLQGAFGVFFNWLANVATDVIEGDFAGAWQRALEMAGGAWDAFAGAIVMTFADAMNRVIDLANRAAQAMIKPLMSVGAVLAGMVDSAKGVISGRVRSIEDVVNTFKGAQIVAGAGAVALGSRVDAAAAGARSVLEGIGAAGRARAAGGGARVAAVSAGGFERFLEALRLGTTGGDAGGSSEIAAGARAIQKGASTAGSFSARALGRLGTPEQRTARATEDLKRIAEEELRLTRRLPEEIGKRVGFT